MTLPQVVCRLGHPLNGCGWVESVMSLWRRGDLLEHRIEQLEARIRTLESK